MRGGEIDIIARETGIIVFVEVRSLSSELEINPVMTIGPHKREKIRRTAMHYLLRENLIDSVDCRFDVVGVLLKDEGPEIIHIKDAFRF